MSNKNRGEILEFRGSDSDPIFAFVMSAMAGNDKDSNEISVPFFARSRDLSRQFIMLPTLVDGD